MLNYCRGLHLPAKLLLTHSILRQSRMRTWPQHSLTLTTGAALASWWRGVETGECSGNLCKIILNYFIFITISYLRAVSQPLWPDPAISAAMTSALSSLLRSPPTGDEPGNMIVSVPGVNNIVLRSGVSKYCGHRTNIWRLLYIYEKIALAIEALYQSSQCWIFESYFYNSWLVSFLTR